MSFRALTIFLLALNLTLAAYAWVQPEKIPEPVATELPGVPKLVLLSERSDAQMRQIADNHASSHASVAPTGTNSETSNIASNPVPNSCQRVGPFESEAAAKRLMQNTALLQAAQIIKTQEVDARGYWVFLPSTDGANARDVALAKARQLSAAGVRDYYVVTAGDRENTISLGMFRDAINADKRVAQVAALGFYPKREERGDPVIRYWLRAPSNDAQRAELRAALDRKLRIESSDCAGAANTG